jgi:cellulose synthase/poly-beta-1,6-N-acetylglucosamine synthase-like glycosyltransferase
MTTTGELAILCAYYAAFGVLVVFAIHRLHLVRLLRKSPSAPDLTSLDLKSWPAVVVQLPLYNEPRVAERLIDAAVALQYPGRLSIQVLDDSTDETSSIVAACVGAAQERGVNITHLRRTSRVGYKAGALAAGMLQSEGEIFAIFDADFVPASDVLMHMIRPFADPGVGMVQARWGHLNRSESLLTRLQALYLDSHFAVESAARSRQALFFNFNGTAGLWRRQAIVEAGGWSADTLTEDLDLSYRAQLAGWRFAFLPNLEIPGELPGSMHAFENQQHRWARGSIQTATKLLGRIGDAQLSRSVKIESVFHLTSNVGYLITLFLAVLLVPVLEIRSRIDAVPFAITDLVLFAVTAFSLVVFCREGQSRVGQTRISILEFAALLPLGVALAPRISCAVIEGLFQSGGYFQRTPKNARVAALERPPRIPVAELILLLFFLGAAAVFLTLGRWVALPFLVVFLTGFAASIAASAGEWFRWLKYSN